MKIKSIALLLIIVPLFVFAGCTGSENQEKQTAKPQVEDSKAVPALDEVEKGLDAAELALVAKAKADLAELLAVDINEIELVAFRPVIWADGSLGCPKPGMAYTQVQVDGYSILLRVKDIYYDYHGGGAREPFLCEAKGSYNSLTPVPQHPADQ